MATTSMAIIRTLGKIINTETTNITMITRGLTMTQDARIMTDIGAPTMTNNGVPDLQDPIMALTMLLITIDQIITEDIEKETIIVTIENMALGVIETKEQICGTSPNIGTAPTHLLEATMQDGQEVDTIEILKLK